MVSIKAVKRIVTFQILDFNIFILVSVFNMLVNYKKSITLHKGGVGNAKWKGIDFRVTLGIFSEDLIVRCSI